MFPGLDLFYVKTDDIDLDFQYPKPYNKIYNLEDALKAGELFHTDVPKSDGVLFNKSQTELNQYPGGKTGAYSIKPP